MSEKNTNEDGQSCDEKIFANLDNATLEVWKKSLDMGSPPLFGQKVVVL